MCKSFGANRAPRPERLAEKLLALRRKLGVSQLKLSRQLSVDAVRVHEYETGRREPNLMVLLRYARLTQVSVESLIDDEIELPF